MGNQNKYKSGSIFDMQFITSSISTTLVLLLLGLVVFFVLTAHNLSVYVRENISFSVLISDDMKEADILKLQKKLNQEPFVKQSEYISKKQALKEQTEAMGTDPEEFLGIDPARGLPHGGQCHLPFRDGYKRQASAAPSPRPCVKVRAYFRDGWC